MIVCVCVCVCARARVRACVRACACVCVREYVRLCVHASARFRACGVAHLVYGRARPRARWCHLV